MTEPSYLTEIRTAYDIVAADYAELLKDELDATPVDRAILGAFAELARDRGPVGDLGCGPGRLTGYLASLGLDVFGVDLSPEMVAVARRTHPGLRFEVGSLTALDLPDGQLGGIVAWYSIIHTPLERLGEVFAEFARVLAPEGQLVLGFQAGDEIRHLENAYGHDISLNAYRLRPELIAELVQQHGFVVSSRVRREPERWEPTPQAYILAHKP
ncbi:class I SAM-dependent methyltransferase [Amycolatopsis acidicola]|uniref:Class I SAM-dependent methyltransferase n=1 Tax=Amycolatopsis acidicola TaxID=2596893 RepID=A0A5N0VJ87_9PSEU|nr:class I SAM-dependent methyltransferase [Amycolatopsis acidicola]KAA9166379.1 class I SAM-dependent methyltransferase [Amycolatopsis acidicola]